MLTVSFFYLFLSHASYYCFQLRIDLDQQKIEELLELESDEGFAAAQRMYQEGSFSKTVSNLTISGGLPIAVPQKTKMVGASSVANNSTTATSKQGSGAVEVFSYANYTEGSTEMRVQYISEGCYVGANPDPVTAGCKSSQCVHMVSVSPCII